MRSSLIQDMTVSEFVTYASRYFADAGEEIKGAQRTETYHADGHLMDVCYIAHSVRLHPDGQPALILEVEPETWPPAPVWLEPIPAKS